MRISGYRSSSGASLVAMSFFLATQANAQTQPPPPPQPVNVDGNGVDLATRTLIIDATDLRIGPDDERGLRLDRQWAESGWRISTTPVMSGNSTDPIIVYGGRSTTFHLDSSSGKYVPSFADGATLSDDATVYIAADGTEIEFVAVDALVEHPSAIKAAKKIIFPNGVEHSFTYRKGTREIVRSTGEIVYQKLTRLSSINSSTGYQLKFRYRNDDIASAAWQSIRYVTSINNMVEYCSATTDFCEPTVDWPTVSYRSRLDNVPDVTDPEGRVTTYGYTNDMLTSITPPGEGSSATTVAYAGTKVLTVKKGGGTWGYVNPGPSQTAMNDAAGQATVFNFDGAGYVTGILNPKNEFTEFVPCTGTSNCPAGLMQKAISPERDYTLFEYDARGNVTRQTHYPKPGSNLAPIVTSATYPATCGNPKTCNKPLSTTDAKGNVTDYAWKNTHGGLIKVERPAPQAGADRPTTTVTYASVQANYLTSANGRVTSPDIAVPNYVKTCRTSASCSDSADEKATGYGYEASSTPNNALPTSVTLKTGDVSIREVTGLSYSPLGDIAAIDGPLPGTGDTLVIFRNKARQETGRIGPSTATNPSLAQRTSYDDAGRPWQVETGYTAGQNEADLANLTASASTSMVFDKYGRQIRQIAKDATGTKFAMTQTSYDNAGRVTCATTRMNPAVYQSVPSDACVQGVQGSYGPDRIARYAYDQLGRVTSLVNGYGTADAATEYSLGYTRNGLVETVADGANNLTTYVYDGHDRNVQVLFPVAANGAGQSSPTDYEQYGFDPNGNVTSFRTRRDETLVLGYDKLDRLITKIVPGRFGLSSSNTRNVYYSYDLFGDLTSARFDGVTGEGVLFDYDALGRKISETSTMDGVTRTLLSTYDLANRRTSLTYPDNYVAATSYDAAGRLDQIQFNGDDLVRARFADNGLPAGLDRYRPGGGWDAATAYSFDSALRFGGLTMDHTGTAADSASAFTYNPAGQITSRAQSNDAYAWDAQANFSRGYTSNGLNQYSKAGLANFAYDANGNLTGDGTEAFGYDVENRLVTRAAGNVRLRYDPLGRLYEIRSDLGVDTRYVYNGDAMVAVYNRSGTMLDRYIHGPGAGVDDPLVHYNGSAVTSSARQDLYSDERGSIVAITDASGNVVNINSYDSYGIPGSANAGAFQYTGQLWLPELGMYYYKARMYSPTLGRFLQTDPIGYGDGMNMYRYVRNDPVNAIDPTGLSQRCYPRSNQDGYSLSYYDSKGQLVIKVVADTYSDVCYQTSDGVPRGNGGNSNGGSGSAEGPQKEQPQKPSVSDCLLFAGKKNGVNLALDAAGAALVFASAEFQVAAAIGGSVIGVIGLGVSAVNRDATGAGLAFVGKQAANAGGLAQAGSALARGASKFGAAAVLASSARDLVQAYADYQQCRAGAGQ